MEFIVVSEQLTYMLYSAVFGVVMSLIYTLIKILRITVGVTKGKKIKLKLHGPWRSVHLPKCKGLLSVIFVHIIDILYLIFAAVAFCIFVFAFNHGRIRWYLLLSALAGFVAWYYSLGKVIMYVSEYIVYVVKSFTKLLIYVIMLPIGLAVKPVKRIFGMIVLRIHHLREIKKLRKYIFEG